MKRRGMDHGTGMSGPELWNQWRLDTARLLAEALPESAAASMAASAPEWAAPREDNA